VKIELRYFFVLLILSINSCRPITYLYKDDHPKKRNVVSLSKEDHDQLLKFLSKYQSRLNDTVIIKYDFNHETCWDRLDVQTDDYIKRVENGFNERIVKAIKERPAISVFHFRETGNDFNKYVKRNADIIIDSSGLIKKLLFDRRTVCGSSAIILPGGRSVILKSDSHFMAMQNTSVVITEAKK
jgi:hypothetical protein